ncbi:MAG: hypothetical protein NTX33_18040 [Propionibacteriales bacterium]|nr:hypothetical protein [Propionibacteriales bacterium]
MSGLADYEHIGDLSSPFAVTKKQQRRQKEREGSRSSRCTVSGLGWEAYVAGEPCPGCHRPYRDDVPWVFRGTMHFTDDERARYDAEEARYKANHGGCRAHWHGVSGSLTMHCGKCCPPPPMSPSQIESISKILESKTPEHDLMRWRLRLFCGHVVERRAHYTHKTVQAAFSERACPECNLDPATVIDAEPIGLVAERPSPSAAVTPKPAKPTRIQLETRVRELESELARLRPDASERVSD